MKRLFIIILLVGIVGVATYAQFANVTPASSTIALEVNSASVFPTE